MTKAIKPQTVALVNPSGEPLTPQKLRSFWGCEHYSDEEAVEIIESLSTLARILVSTCCKKPMHIDNQQVVSLNGAKQTIKQAA